MTHSLKTQTENYEHTFTLLLTALGDGAFDLVFFDPALPPFNDIFSTTWERLIREEFIQRVSSGHYRLTVKGWLYGIQFVGFVQLEAYQQRLGKLLATLKRYVKGRAHSEIKTLDQVANDSGEPVGWIYNVIESKAGTGEKGKIGATWYQGEKGRLIEIPPDFNIKDIDVQTALSLKHRERIEQLEAKLKEFEEDRAQFHCPYCDAPFMNVHHEDFIEYHCIVTYEIFACGYSTADGEENYPCPYGPNWPPLEEFDFLCEQDGQGWTCRAVGKTRRAKRVTSRSQSAPTKEEAEQKMKTAIGRKQKTPGMWKD